MSIEHLKEKIKPFYLLILGILIACLFFGLGRLSALEERKTPIKIEYPQNSQTASVLGATGVEEGGEVIGSKSGKKYYFPWCGTVKRIKPENQLKFASIEEAKKAGFTPGGNCKGLE